MNINCMFSLGQGNGFINVGSLVTFFFHFDKKSLSQILFCFFGLFGGFVFVLFCFW